MTLADIIATIGVTILLIAFALNTRNLISSKSKTYHILNIIGALLCGYSSYLIGFYPFVVLEGAWAGVAAFGLFTGVSRETPTGN